MSATTVATAPGALGEQLVPRPLQAVRVAADQHEPGAHPRERPGRLASEPRRRAR